MTPRLMLLPLAFALVATVTFASPAGEDDAAATATEKEMVLDPSTGEMVTAPEYGGTIRPVVNFKVEGIDPYYRYTAGVWIGLVNQKLGFADWAIDRDVYDYKTTYLPDRAVVGGLAESWENPDPLTYVFKLRDDVFWHDKAPVNGRQLTAHDFEAVNLQTTNPDLELHPLAYRAETAFTFNTRIEPWSDIRVRQALSMAIDFEFFDLGYYQIAMDLRTSVWAAEYGGALIPFADFWSKREYSRPANSSDAVFDEYYEKAVAATTVEQQQEWSRKTDLRVAEVDQDRLGEHGARLRAGSHSTPIRRAAGSGPLHALDRRVVGSAGAVVARP